ncbi:MAG TPA: RDD family protein [Microvirga sp.]|jgi:uncharacterized RDD family membrane protein YckC|nr:RDD family protein [Microvirga sp.]
MTSGYGASYVFDPRATDGTLGRRFFAYLIDIVVIFALWGVLWLAIAILGLFTLGLGWLLFSLLPFTAIIYNAVTISGPAQGTIGMRLAGVRVFDATTGGRVSFLAAAVHALLFYVALGAAALLWIADVLFGFVREDRRLGRDLITNVVFLRA